MCGRIAQYSEPQRVARRLGAQLVDATAKSWEPHWNVGPTSMILGAHDIATSAMRAEPAGTERVLQDWQWGLVPHYDHKRRIFNVRGESVATNGLFAGAFRGHRVLIPVDGFYEWADGPKGKTPHYFTRADGDALVFAGLSDQWFPDPVDRTHFLLTATIITTAATSDMEGIHTRQPAVLEADTWDAWLDKSADRDGLTALLHGSAGVLVHHPVDRRVGSVRNDDAGLIEASATSEPSGSTRPDS
jgi:putative SOS response-associated peptidase YedK